MKTSIKNLSRKDIEYYLEVFDPKSLKDLTDINKNTFSEEILDIINYYKRQVIDFIKGSYAFQQQKVTHLCNQVEYMDFQESVSLILACNFYKKASKQFFLSVITGFIGVILTIIAFTFYRDLYLPAGLFMIVYAIFLSLHNVNRRHCKENVIFKEILSIRPSFFKKHLER